MQSVLLKKDSVKKQIKINEHNIHSSFRLLNDKVGLQIYEFSSILRICKFVKINVGS